MRLYLLGIAVAALVLLTSFVLREKNRAELQLQQQNDALAAAAQSYPAAAAPLRSSSTIRT